MTPHIAAVIFGKLTRTPVAIDLRDPWAGNPAWMESARWSTWLDGLAERVCLSAAQIVTCASPGIERRLVARSDALRRKTHVIFNGFDEEDRMSGVPPAGALRMLYAGALYADRNPFPVLECLADLIRSGRVDRARVTFDFIGEADGWRGRSIEDWAASNSLQDVVRYGGRVSRSQVASLVASANVLVNFAQGQGDMIPAKTFQYLASGRAMLVVTERESDTARVLAGVEAAICVDDRDRPDVERTLLGLYRRFTIGPTDHSRVPHDVERFSRLRQNEAWTALLEYDSPVARAETA